MDPEIREMPERVTLMRRQVIHPHDIGMTIGRGAEELREWLQAAGVEVLGPPYARYHSWTKEAADVEVGFEVDRPIDLAGVATASLSAGREAVAVHRGAYKDIPKTFGALEAWVDANAEARDAPREVYVSDSDGAALDDHITEIVYPIA